jgi:hypothetical protein
MAVQRNLPPSCANPQWYVTQVQNRVLDRYQSRPRPAVRESSTDAAPGNGQMCRGSILNAFEHDVNDAVDLDTPRELFRRFTHEPVVESGIVQECKHSKDV